jgi:hypothetical protein
MPGLFTEDEVRQLIATAVAEAIAPLHEKIAQLEAGVARLKKNSGNSSKPPSSDIVKPPKPNTAGRHGKRSIGGLPRHAKHERKPVAPEDVDRIVECALPAAETRGPRPLARWVFIGNGRPSGVTNTPPLPRLRTSPVCCTSRSTTA